MVDNRLYNFPSHSLATTLILPYTFTSPPIDTSILNEDRGRDEIYAKVHLRNLTAGTTTWVKSNVERGYF